MEELYPLLWVLLYILFVVTDAVFFGFGAAIQNVNTKELEKDMESGSRKAGKILKIVNRPGRFINTIQIIAVLFGFLSGGMTVRQFAKSVPATVLFYLIALILMVSFGIVAPKKLAERKPEKWAYRMIGPVNCAMTILQPVIWPVHALSWLILKIFGIDLNKQEENVTEEDIMSMVNEGHEQGVVQSDEAEMITNIFKLNDKQASDVMTHRKNIVAMNEKTLLKEAVDFMLTEGSNSRYPVYKTNIDNITGTLNLKDAITWSYKGEWRNRKLSEIPGLLRKAYFIPETRALDTLFREMQSEKIHMEIVVDEYGQTSGIVTMEDILEEIVGNIMDEYDDDEEMITSLKDGTWIVKGLTPLNDLTDGIGVRFTEQEYDDFDTLNGFLIAKLDRIPSDGEQFTTESHGFIFKVIHVQNKIIRTVRITEKRKIREEKPEGALKAAESGEPEETD